MPGSSCWRPRRQRLSPARPPCQPRRAMHCGARAGGKEGEPRGRAALPGGGGRQAVPGPARIGPGCRASPPLRLRTPPSPGGCSPFPSAPASRASLPQRHSTKWGCGNKRLRFFLHPLTGTPVFPLFSPLFHPRLLSMYAKPQALWNRVRACPMLQPGPCSPFPQGFPPLCSILWRKPGVPPTLMVNRGAGEEKAPSSLTLATKLAPAAARESVLASMSAGSSAGLGGEELGCLALGSAAG